MFFQGALYYQNMQSNALLYSLLSEKNIKQPEVLNDDNNWSFIPTAVAEWHPPDKGCFENIGNSSSEYKSDVNWSTMMSPIRQYNSQDERGEMPVRTITDLNGDGLPDLLYIDHSIIEINSDMRHYSIKDCVLLNNGNGWDLAYRCKTEYSGNGNTRYYGNCAKFD